MISPICTFVVADTGGSGNNGEDNGNLSVPIVESYLPSNYQHGTQIIKRLVLHDTGNVRGDSAINNYNYFLTNADALNSGTTAHAFIDDEQLLLTIPENQKAWHVRGSYQGESFNEESYGLELCNLLTQEAVDKQFNNAAQYYAQMCIKYNLNPHEDIYSHNELTELGNVQGGHSDPDAYLAKWGYNMDIFRDLVSEYMK